MTPLTVEPFRPYHLSLLIAQGVQSSQAREVSHVPASYASLERPPGLSMTVKDQERIVLVGGITELAPRYGLLWAVLSQEAGRHLLFLHRATQRFIALKPWRRLEAS